MQRQYAGFFLCSTTFVTWPCVRKRYAYLTSVPNLTSPSRTCRTFYPIELLALLPTADLPVALTAFDLSDHGARSEPYHAKPLPV